MDTRQQIKSLFTSLNKHEREVLLVELTSIKELDKNADIKSDVESCPFCGDTNFVKNGKHRGAQRYICKTCNRNFVFSTGAAYQGIKKKDKFESYKSIMFKEGFIPLKTMSSRIGISMQTAFDWRHKILCSLKPIDDKFENITEIDDVWFLYSQKGRKGLKYSRKRGGSKRKGDNDFQVKMLITSDRNNTKDLSVVRIGRLRSNDIDRKIGSRLEANSILVSDKHNSIKSFAKKNKIKHVSFKSSEHIADSQHHVQTVNNMAARLKGNLNHSFRGVSTKYLQSYANWFQFLETYKGDSDVISKVDKCLDSNNSWDIFTNIEALYKKFIKEYSKRTYRCPTKREWKTQLKDTASVTALPYL